MNEKNSGILQIIETRRVDERFYESATQL